MSKSTVVFSDDNFENEVIKADIPVLVDFWAEWCGPCRMVGPVVEEIAEDYQGKIKVGKLNVDENPKISSLAGIRSIPTLLIFKNGKAVSRIIGAVPKSRIADMIDGVINGA